MNQELKYSVSKFESALQRLIAGITSVKDELDKDGVIQRLEFTFELMWKTLKIYLEEKGILCKSPKDSLQQAFKYGLISDEELYLKMLNDRNRTSHIYSQDVSEEIFSNIVSYYSNSMNILLGELKKDI